MTVPVEKPFDAMNLLDYMPKGYQAYAFLVSYGTVNRSYGAKLRNQMLGNSIADVVHIMY